MPINDGGPAFPRVPGPFIPGEGVAWNGFDGMSLRDYFAGQALAGYMTGVENPQEKFIAENCYRVADAMIVHRQQEEEPPNPASEKSAEVDILF